MNRPPRPARAPRRGRNRAPRALSHPPSPTAPPSRGTRAAALAGLLTALLAAACDARAGEGDPAGAPDPAQAEPGTAALPETPATDQDREDLARLIAAFEPIDPTLTSDRQDAWLAEQRAVLARLRARVRDGGAPGLARLALDTYEQRPELPDEVRIALLEIAAGGFGPALAPRLEELVTTYDSELGLRVRTAAVRVLAESAPERALEFLAPLAREERPSSTRPPQAALVEAWIVAARALRERGDEVDTRVLADVATDIFQPADARYAAIGGLGELGGKLAPAALEEVLTEASSDGYVRRKAAQALTACSTPEHYCPILAQVASHESDPVFLNFLGDMIDRHCAGVEVTTGHEGHDH